MIVKYMPIKTTFKMTEVLFTSDTHFNHTNILKYCKRPFKTVEEMNETFILNWNKKVRETDYVFHLGDFVYSKREHDPVLPYIEFRQRLNGHVILIKGNHDLFGPALDDVFDYVTQQMTIMIGNKKIIMNHYPLLTYAGAENNRTWALHGHNHSGPYKSLDERMLLRYPTQYDVGVDNNSYSPISFLELKKIIDQQIKDKEK